MSGAHVPHTPPRAQPMAIPGATPPTATPTRQQQLQQQQQQQPLPASGSRASLSVPPTAATLAPASPPGGDHAKVLRRLSALFSSDGDPGSPRSGIFAPDSPVQTSGMQAVPIPDPQAFKDRGAIKVKVVTWNMGDALGDLGVLLGEVPTYEPPAEKSSGLPELPLADAHPYHVVVFAAQECPAMSGMPRGLGGSLMKGVGLQKSEPARRERDEKKERDQVAKKVIRDIRAEMKNRESGSPSSGVKESKAATGTSDSGKGHSRATSKDTCPPSGNSSDEAPSKSQTSESVTPPPGAPPADDVPVAATTGASAPVLPPVQMLSIETAPNTFVASPIDGPLTPPFASATPRANGFASADTTPTPTPMNGVGGAVVANGVPNGNACPVEPNLPAEACQGCVDADNAAKEVSLQQPAAPPAPEAPLTPKPSEERLKGPKPGRPEVGALKGASPFDLGLGSPMHDLAASASQGRAAPRGWSAMLEEWLCAGPPVVVRDTTSSPVQNGNPSLPEGEYQQSNQSRTTSMSSLTRPTMDSGSMPISVPARRTSLIPGDSFGLSVPRAALAQSIDSLGSFSLSTPFEEKAGRTDRPPRPILPRSFSGREVTRSVESPIQCDEEAPLRRFYRKPDAGPYVNVAKERLLGLYISVFVYKGCEHLVKGVDKGFVTAGLAGGRFGNKGGVGVSLNLDNHRLLFVNAHLAAHAERNEARLANISKIKSELNLDCFLPADDPRASMEDITDRFDTTFWCGDLNFRVDISLLHAKWLLEQKKYQDALMFDQLRTAMSDPKTNPLPGFEEADITFMPTFKYDVWKSARATNKELRRSIRKRSRPEKGEKSSSIDREKSPGALDFVPEVDVVEESSDAPDSPEARATLMPPMCAQLGMSPVAEMSHLYDNGDDCQSVTSSIDLEEALRSPPSNSPRHTRTASRKSTGTRSERSTNGDAATPSVRVSSPATRPSMDALRVPQQELKKGALGLKAKTQKLMGILRLGKKPAATRPTRATSGEDESSRRQSISSFRSNLISEDGHVSAILSDEGETSGVNEVESSAGGHTSSAGGHTTMSPVLPDGMAVQRITSGASVASRRQLGSPTRRPRLMRTLSGRSSTRDDDGDDPHFDDSVDHRVGVYDTSKKQRVPSWCDRVLWKTHVVPDVDEVEFRDSFDQGPSPFFRLSNAFSNFSDRLRRRSSVVEQNSIPPDVRPGPSMSGTLSTLPEQANGMPTSISAPGGLANIAPDDAAEELSPVFESSGPGTPAENETTSSPLPLTPSVPEDSVAPAQPQGRSVSNPASNPPPINGAPRLRQERARSVTFTSPPPMLQRGSTWGSDMRTRRVSSSAATDSSPSVSRRSSGSLKRRASLGGVRRTPSRRRSAETLNSSSSPPLYPLSPVKSTGHMYSDDRRPRNWSGSNHRASESSLQSAQNGPQSLGNALTRFFRDLPGRFHSRVSLFHGSEPDYDANVPERPRRHLAGEVSVLHYGTIDDAGMRQLEGRSDHRPAIFSAALYV